MGAAAKWAMPLAALPLLACALLLSGGARLGPLTWIGSAALVLAAAGVAGGTVPRLDGAAAGLLACLAGLVVWCGLTVLWSIRPDESWQFTNRTLVYLA